MMSSRPVDSVAWATKARISSTWRTSRTWASPLPPAALILDSDSAMGSGVRPPRTTWAPAEPRDSAMARPIPLEAPVTTAVLPARDVSGAEDMAALSPRRHVQVGRRLVGDLPFEEGLVVD